MVLKQSSQKTTGKPVISANHAPKARLRRLLSLATVAMYRQPDDEAADFLGRGQGTEICGVALPTVPLVDR